MATTGATTPGTRTQSAEAFSHVIDNVLEWDATSPGRQYCVDQMYSKMGDLLNMDKAEINDMEYKKSKVSMKIKKQIKHLQAWFTWKSAQQTGGYVDATVWKALTSDEFETFCDVTLPAIKLGPTCASATSSVVNTSGTSTSGVTGAHVKDFDHGHRCDVKTYVEFHGVTKKYFCVRRQ